MARFRYFRNESLFLERTLSKYQLPLIGSGNDGSIGCTGDIFCCDDGCEVSGNLKISQRFFSLASKESLFNHSGK